MNLTTYLALFVFVATPLSTHAQASPEGSSGKPEAEATVSEMAEVLFTSDSKYETKNGMPLKGTPFVCSSGSVSRVGGDGLPSDRMAVKAGEEVAVTSAIAWRSTGFRLTCAPFVSFVPEKGARYAVVNERIGGKGVSVLWSAPARQTCKVSVYKETPDGFTNVQTRPVAPSQCKAPEV